MRYTLTAAILLLSALNFNCSLNGGKYEYIRFSAHNEEFYLENETKNYLDDSGYYVMHAEDSVGRWSADIILPQDDYFGVIYIPYDNFTEIRITDNSSEKIFVADAARGRGEFSIESRPDSAFHELSGSFSGELINILDDSDTLFVSGGYFIFVF